MLAGGAAHDHEACVRSIAQNKRTPQQQKPGGARLKVQAFFRNSDAMIGNGRQEYFEQC